MATAAPTRSGSDAMEMPLSASAMRVSRLQEGGVPLGVLPDAKFPEFSGRLAAGDRLLMYTDGITEAANRRHEIFGEERLGEVFAAGAGLALDAAANSILKAVERFAEGAIQADDQALLLMEVAA